MGKSRTLLVLALLVVWAGFPRLLRAQNVSVSPTGLSFGTIPLQQSSAPRPIVVSNTGSGPVQINSIIASGGYTETSV